MFYEFRNDEASGLGMPMPAGIVRVYQADAKGGIQFAGEDRIDHTPKDEDITLKIGTAFDVVCERKQIDFEKIAEGVYEMAFEITLRNHKATPITVAGERTDRRRLADADIDHPAHEDRGVGRAVRGAGGGQRQQCPEVPGAREVVGV